MFKKVKAIAKISLLTLAMTGLLAGCGTMVDLDSKTPANNNEVVESKEEKTEESKETEATETSKETETTSEETTESSLEEITTETAITENEKVYIVFEDIETTTMYVSWYSELYADINATEGEFILIDDLEEGEAVKVDGKGTYEGQEIYRVVREDDSIYPYDLIIHAKTLKPADNTETKEEELDPFFNGDSYDAPLIETEEKYIKYEAIEPVKMYVTKYSDVYIDFNITEGEFMIGSYIFEGEEVNIDAKGTYKDVEYYRVVRPEDSFSTYHLIIPADALSFEKPAVDSNTNSNQAVNETSNNSNTSLLPEEEPSIPEWTPDTGVSKEDWDKFFGINTSSRQYNWEPDHGEDFYIDENGNIWDSGIDPEILEKAGNIIVY